MKFVFALDVSIFSKSQYCILVKMSSKTQKSLVKIKHYYYKFIKCINNIWGKENYILKEWGWRMNWCSFCVILLHIHGWPRCANNGMVPRNHYHFFFVNFKESISQKVAFLFFFGIFVLIQNLKSFVIYIWNPL